MMYQSGKKSSEQVDRGHAVGVVGSVIRDRINAARVACVLMMMYVHVPNGIQSGSTDDALDSTRLDHWLESILVEGPGRSGAALLSVVSGYLIVHTLVRHRQSVVKLYKRRFVSIVIPMFFWASLTCLVYLILQGRDSFIGNAHYWYEKLNLVLFVYKAPYGATLHLGFLRDLFVCILLSPLILFALRKVPALTIGALGIVYLFEHSGQLVIILRPLVVLGFAIGMLLALQRVRLDSLDKHWALFLCLMGVFTVLIIWTNAGLLGLVERHLDSWGVSLKETILYPLCRLFGSLAIWSILPLWASTQLARLASWCAPYLFAAFCSHFLVLSVLFNGLWLPVAGDRDAYVYIVWFLSAPLIAMVMAVVMVNVAARIFPPLATLITGGRFPVERLHTRVGGKLAHAI